MKKTGTTPTSRTQELITRQVPRSVRRRGLQTVRRCYSLSCPHYYKGKDGKLRPIDLTPRDADGVMPMSLADRGVHSVGIRRDGNPQKFIGIRPDVSQEAGAHQFEISLTSVTLDGVEQSVALSAPAYRDGVTDLGLLLVQNGRTGGKILTRAKGPSFKIVYQFHLKGYKFSEAGGEFTFTSDVDKFSIKRPKVFYEDLSPIIPREIIFPHEGKCSQCGKCCTTAKCPKFINGECSIYEDRPEECKAYPQPYQTLTNGCKISVPDLNVADWLAPLVTHSIKKLGDGLYEYTKESTPFFAKLTPYLPDDYLVDVYWSSGSDAGVGYVDAADWPTAHDAATGTVVASGTGDTLGALRGGEKTPTYDCSRLFFYFDTSGIASVAMIEAAELNIYVLIVYGLALQVIAMKGTQADAATTADYDSFTGSSYGASANLVVNQYNAVTFNEQGRDDIEKGAGAVTKVCVRENVHDYDDMAPDGDYRAAIAFTDMEGTDKDPYLDVEIFGPQIRHIGPQGGAHAWTVWVMRSSMYGGYLAFDDRFHLLGWWDENMLNWVGGKDRDGNTLAEPTSTTVLMPYLS